MEVIISKLKAKAETVPDNALLRDTISLLTDLHRNPAIAQRITWDGLIRDFERLQDEGLWEISEDNTKLLHTLRSFVNTRLDGPASVISGPSRPPVQGSFSIVYPDSANAPSPLIPTSDPVVLPLELVEILNRTYFHHLLATDPKRVVPPGKSLVSMLSHSSKEGENVAKPTLRDKVEDLVHKAFWDEAIESLSNPEPSYQLPRIKLLYHDLLIALKPLLPPRHPVIITLSSPLSPTSSPLDSAIMHLREVVVSLRARCAPVQDRELDDLLHSLDEPPPRSSRPTSLATLVAEAVKSILKISEMMKDQLSQFVLGSMTEQQLQSAVSKQAKVKERNIILDLWKHYRIESNWLIWLLSCQPSFQVSGIAAELRFKWIVRLVQALGSSTPISCRLPTRTLSTTNPGPHVAEPPDPSPPFIDNSLPPIFFFSVRALLEIQNYLQALVIAASLRTLIRAPQGAQASDAMSFMERIWILLKAEIIEEPGSGDTKLVHLADEVVRARQLDGTILSAEEETRLRAAVARTLNPDDAVFMLLQKRVLKALVDTLAHQRSEPRQAGTPPKMQTGHHVKRAEKRPQLMIVLNPEDFDADHNAKTPRLSIGRVQGFEDKHLKEVLEEVFAKVDHCIRWVEGIWQDVLQGGVVDRELAV
ncbi:uncharacterized protein EDB91DRAFT_1146564 [Suillus paluster]|uniref:uncharacterized protein n=1 Tax=Suillus paluster TaxID=48578 RepID=UPI001B87A0E6|nr:uncharacterized protein EDB91DRAFT_1146564 [Suillus paluster]KAG1734730.1 hypothetical protein EDB91DRAFT_1146564 [Suillus paluster]